jgi:cysteine desulfurase
VAPRTYLDHAAATPMLPAARAALTAALDRWANPSSPHGEGRAAKAALEEARTRIKAALGWPHPLIFTSGASEAIGLAFARLAAPRPVLVGATEHLAVLRQAPADAPVIPVGPDGLIDPGSFGALLRANLTALVAVQHANSETGIVQPISALAQAVHTAAGLMLVDCAQTAGKLPLPAEADLLVVSAHKLGGPPGVGALLVRDLALLRPVGRGQEQGYRAGTENLPAILGFAAALAEVTPDASPAWVREQAGWRALLDDAVRRLGGAVIGGDLAPAPQRIATIASYRFPGHSAASLLVRLDLAGFAVSAGSACSSGSIQASHVLEAMDLDEQAAREAIRISFGWSTAREEIERLIAALERIVGSAKADAA